MVAARGEGPAIGEIWAYDRADQYAFLARLARDCDRETAVLYRNNDSALPVLDLLNRQGIGLPVPAGGGDLLLPIGWFGMWQTSSPLPPTPPMERFSCGFITSSGQASPRRLLSGRSISGGRT